VAELILVRHGQANTGAMTEADYDRLSDLGKEQARWLGDYMRQTNGHFDHVYCGTLRRHRETAEAMGFDNGLQQDTRLNEMEYFSLAEAFKTKFDVPLPKGPEDFAHHLPRVLSAWQDDALDDIPERFSDFDARVDAVLSEIAAPGGRSLIVTSGGVISMVLRRLLSLQLDAHANMLLQTMNSSCHRIEALSGRFVLAQFNGIPHLEHPSRAHARTFV
jgi:broad specificity phosphatase PhoE